MPKETASGVIIPALVVIFRSSSRSFFFPVHGSDEELLETTFYMGLHHFSGFVLADEPKIHYL